MSIRLMTAVWEESPYAEGKLLVHLALADASSDQGYTFLSVSKLMKKARLSDRHVRRILAEMRKESTIEQVGTTPKGVLVYRVLPAPPATSVRADACVTGIAEAPTPDTHVRGDNLSGGDTNVRRGVTLASGPAPSHLNMSLSVSDPSVFPLHEQKPGERLRPDAAPEKYGVKASERDRWVRFVHWTYEVYPKPKASPNAWKKYRKIPVAQLDDLDQQTRVYADTLSDKQYAKNPETFLNDDWMAIEPIAPARSNGHHRDHVTPAPTLPNISQQRRAAKEKSK